MGGELPADRAGAYSAVMSIPGAPVCPRHEGEIPMRLRTLHTDSGRPGQLVGLFECPDCGDERRLPLESGEAV